MKEEDILPMQKWKSKFSRCITIFANISKVCKGSYLTNPQIFLKVESINFNLDESVCVCVCVCVCVYVCVRKGGILASPYLFSLYNSEKVKAVTLAFFSIP